MAEHPDDQPEATPRNAGFDDGTTTGWEVEGDVRAVSDVTDGSAAALRLGPGRSQAWQKVRVRGGTKYRLSATVRAATGAEEVRLGVRGHGRGEKSAALSWSEFRRLDVFFSTGREAKDATIYLLHPSGDAGAWADSVELVGLGPADELRYDGMRDSIEPPPERVLVEQLGIRQLSDAEMAPLMDRKFGLFLHWGLYAGPGRGEWLRFAETIPQAEYERLARPESGEEYFVADRYDPRGWAKLAREAGMGWLCLTARHHDGFNLFHSPHPFAWHSGDTHGRDFVREYTDAVRAEGLGLGLYYSPLNWRYPSVFDVRGTGAKPNPFGIVTDPAHKLDARVFKEENYANLRQLLTAYGPLDFLFWDGGWLGHSGSDADAAFFHEPGLHLDPANEWPIDPRWLDRDDAGRPLGVMGMVRKHQPRCVTNTRYGWYGDVFDEEQGAPPTGPIRAQPYEKCISMGPAWGYSHTNLTPYPLELLIAYLVNSVVRNMVLLLNVGPDRHGEIHPAFAARLRELGRWLTRMGESIYATRPGPWHPEDGAYGFTCRDHTLYVHLLPGHEGREFCLPGVGDCVVRSARHVWDGKPVGFSQGDDRTVRLWGIDRQASPADTVVAVEFDRPVLPSLRH